MNRIITFNNVGYQGPSESYVKNLNFDLRSNQNTLIVTDDSRVGEILISLLTGGAKPQVGEIRSHRFEDQRYFVGFNNFKNVLGHGAKVNDILNTLINSQKNLTQARDEIDELRMMFNLEKYADHSTTDLPNDVLILLNFLMLMIVRPRLVVVEKLPLPGSDNFRLATLKYIYNYTKKHDISLVVINNSRLIEENLVDRKIIIVNGKIVEDTSINYVSAMQKNAVDNKTKRFDLEGDILAALGGSLPTNENENEEVTEIETEEDAEYEEVTEIETEEDAEYEEETEEETEVEVEDDVEYEEETEEDAVVEEETEDEAEYEDDGEIETEEEIEYEEETEEADEFNDPVVAEDFPESLVVERPKSTVLLKKTTKSFIEIEPHENIPFNTSALQNSLHKKPASTANIDTTSQRLDNITKQLQTLDHTEVLVDQIKFHQANHQKTAVLDAFMGDVGELYQIKKEIELQIKGADFANLSVELQSKVFDNYENTNRLLRENDPKEIYNPDKVTANQTKPLAQVLKNKTIGVTKMIMEEENTNSTPTKQMTGSLPTSILEVRESIQKSTLPQNQAKNPFDSTTNYRPANNFQSQRLTIHPTTAIQSEKITIPLEEDEPVSYHPHPTNRTSNLHTGIVDDYSYVGSDNNNSTAAFENFTVDLDTIEPSSSMPENVNSTSRLEQQSISFVDDIRVTNALNDDEQITMTQQPYTPKAPTPTVKTTAFQPTPNKPYVAPKPFIAKPKKKLTMIEKLYLEALEDINIVEEQKNNKTE